MRGPWPGRSFVPVYRYLKYRYAGAQFFAPTYSTSPFNKQFPQTLKSQSIDVILKNSAEYADFQQLSGIFFARTGWRGNQEKTKLKEKKFLRKVTKKSYLKSYYEKFTKNESH